LQTYLFSNSFSVIETLSGISCLNVDFYVVLFFLPLTHPIFPSFGNFLVDLENKPSEKAKKLPNFLAPVTNNLSSRREHLSTESKESAFKIKNNVVADVLRSNEKGMSCSPVKKLGKEFGMSFDNSGCDSDSRTQNHAASLTNSGNTAKGRDGDGLEEASESLLDATTDPTLPTEVTLIFALVMM
jgi:sorting nexin-13